MSATLSGSHVNSLCPRSSIRSLFMRPICSDSSDSPFSASTKLSSSVCSHTESGTRPSCLFHKFNSEELSGMNQIIACTASIVAHDCRSPISLRRCARMTGYVDRKADTGLTGGFRPGDGKLSRSRIGGHHHPIRCLPARVCRSCLAESLLGAEITFGGLNRCVSKQELNLLKFSAR